MTVSAGNTSVPKLSPKRSYGYYWPTMLKDEKDYVNLCDKCQTHGDMHLAPPVELTSLVFPWLFAWWGIDLLGPFPKAGGQLKYLVVAIDYSTKWIEAEQLAKITAKNVLCFFKRNILVRFGVPALVISDNETQFVTTRFFVVLFSIILCVFIYACMRLFIFSVNSWGLVLEGHFGLFGKQG